MTNLPLTRRCLLICYMAVCCLSPIVGRAHDKQQLFNGKDLSGWDGDPRLWSVKDGVITGETTKETPAHGNTFLIWRGGAPQDFELTFKVKLTGNNPDGWANSGVQIRSVVIDPSGWVVAGLQPDISTKPGQFGGIYHEKGAGRGATAGEKLLVTDPEPGKPYKVDKKTGKSVGPRPERKKIGELGNHEDILAKINYTGWNDCRVVAQGTVIQVLCQRR